MKKYVTKVFDYFNHTSTLKLNEKISKFMTAKIIKSIFTHNIFSKIRVINVRFIKYEFYKAT